MFEYFGGYSKFGTESEHGLFGDTCSIPFIGVTRRSSDKGVVLAAYSHHSKTDLNIIRDVISNAKITNDETFYTISVESLSWCLLAAPEGLIYVLICKSDYPERCAHMCLEEMRRTFEARYMNKVLTAKDNAFTTQFRDQMRKLCIKYNNPGDVDALAATHKKVTAAKIVMQENIQLALNNCVKIEHLEQQTDDLMKQAGVFRINATSMKNRMWWKSLKSKALLVCVVLLVLGALAGVISYIVLKYKDNNADDAVDDH